MEGKKQTGRWSQQELETIKSVFKGNSDLIMEIRNLFFGFRSEVSRPLPDEALKIIKKLMIPDLDPEIPFGAQNDLYHAVQIETLPEIMMNQIKASDVVKDYLTTRFNVLTKLNSSDLKLTDLRDSKEERIPSMMAYKVLVNSFIDSSFSALIILADSKEATLEEIQERMKKDSSK